MGLFSRKTKVCPRCGKEYAGGLLSGDYCDACQPVVDALLEKLGGYVAYRKALDLGIYNWQELSGIEEHRTQILQKYQTTNGVVYQALGCVFTDYFFAPELFDGTFIDKDDIFAVGFTDIAVVDFTKEYLMCAFFTNDPYIPAFGLVHSGKKSFWKSEIHSKEGRGDLVDRFGKMCPNLTYPVADIRELKKAIKAEKKVRGRLTPEFLLSRIGEAEVQNGVFTTKELNGTVGDQTVALLSQAGYNQVLA